jgi:hypothetical protein
MDVVSNIRTEMNNGWELFPEWIKELFLPIKEVVILLLDQGMEVLARDTVNLQQCPVDETIERQDEFNACKQSIIDGINSIINYKDASNPMNSPAVIEELRLATERRKSR